MKRTILMFMLSGISIITMAQNKQTTVTGYGMGTAGISNISGKTSLSIGGYGGVLLNHKWFIGAGGQNIGYNKTINGSKQHFSFNYYGIVTEYRIQPQRPVHLSLGLMGGMGWQENKLVSAKNTMRKDGDATYVIQPRVGLNIKVASFMQIQGYADYRITGKTNSTYNNRNNYNGLSGGIGLAFGKF
jgi:hypothetical protein